MALDANSPFSSVVGLGAFKSEYRIGRVKYVSLTFGVLGLMAAPIALLVGAALAYDAYTKHGLARLADALPVPLLVALVAFVIGVAALAEAWRLWPIAARLYEDGFAFYSRRGLQVVQWSQVESVLQSVTRHYTNGVYTGTTHLYTVQTRDKTKVLLDDKLGKKVEELGRAIQMGASNALFPGYVHALQSGERLQFGPLGLDQNKLYTANKEIAWGEIKAIRISKGVISVKKDKGWFSWTTVTVPRIPNFFIFWELISRLTKVE